MTRHRLVLLRHAKAEQGGRDRHRELTKRGRGDAAAVGAWLAGHDAVPDLAVVSPSRRTAQTWEAASAHLLASPEVRYDERVYDNSVDDLVDVIRDVDATTGTLLLVGHNPSTHALALRLAGGDSERDDMAAFATATVAVFDLDGAWSNAPEGAWQLVAVATCRAANAG